MPNPHALLLAVSLLEPPFDIWASPEVREEREPARLSPTPSAFRIRLSPKAGAEDVRQALEGARRRLEDVTCAAIVGDFEARDGSRLDANLRRLGRTASEYLGLLLFVDGSHDIQCLRRSGVIAWTSPSSRVVRVCMPQLRQRRNDDPALTEALIIHEALHTLGLGENPPSSREITKRVQARCGYRRFEATTLRLLPLGTATEGAPPAGTPE